jgi:5-formyltetrahydrofolate cyclo-ligase
VNKAQLRHDYLARRQLLTIEERELASAHIIKNFFDRFDITEISVLHCFISIEKFGEVDTRPIFQRVWSEFPNVETVVPRIDREKNELESLSYGPDTELKHNRWQIGEPIHNDRIEPAEIDMVLVPLICFDARGHRVGYGKGYYDRLLSRCRPDCKTIGLCMFPPIDEISDAHDGDVRLDHCVTPTETFTF